MRKQRLGGFHSCKTGVKDLLFTESQTDLLKPSGKLQICTREKNQTTLKHLPSTSPLNKSCHSKRQNKEGIRGKTSHLKPQKSCTNKKTEGIHNDNKARGKDKLKEPLNKDIKADINIS